MSESTDRKPVFLEAEVHEAVKLVAAIHGETIQDIVNGAIRDQYDVEALSNLDEESLESPARALRAAAPQDE